MLEAHSPRSTTSSTLVVDWFIVLVVDVSTECAGGSQSVLGAPLVINFAVLAKSGVIAASAKFGTPFMIEFTILA